MAITINRTTSLDGAILPEFMPGLLYMNENQAHKFVITCTRGGSAVTLTGGITGRFMRADGQTILLSGSISSGKANLTLPQSCYIVPGRFTMAIFNVVGNAVTTIYALTGNVARTQTDTLVDPGNTVPTIDNLLAEIDAMRQATADANAAATKAVRYDNTQSLTDANKTTARGNIDAAGLAQVVRHDASQNLTETQKTTARENIDAAGLAQVVRHDASQNLSETQKSTARGNIDAASALIVANKENAVKNGYDILYQKDQMVTGAGRILAETGEIVDVQSGTGFEYVTIPVEPGDTLVFTTNQTSGGAGRGYAIYDKNENYITGKSTPNAQSYTIIVPENAAIFRIGSAIAHWTKESKLFYIAYAKSNYKEYTGDVAYVKRGLFDGNLSLATDAGTYYLGANCIGLPDGVLQATNMTLVVFAGSAAHGDYSHQFLLANEGLAIYHRIIHSNNHIVFADWENILNGAYTNNGLFDDDLSMATTMGTYYLGANCTGLPSGMSSAANMTLVVFSGSAKDGAYSHQFLMTNDNLAIYHRLVYTNLHTVLIDWHNLINGSDDLSAVKWNAVGDSITHQGLYMNYVRNACGISVVNCGLSSSTIAINNTYLQNQSIVERVCGLNGNTAYNDADVWTIMGGLNDVLYKSRLGELANTGSTFDNTTVYGALQSICEYIMGLRQRPRLILMTPTQSVRDTWSKETYGITIAEIRKAIMDVGEYYAVPVVDVWALSGINHYNMQKDTNPTTGDGVHPNSTGAAMLAQPVTKALTAQF